VKDAYFLHINGKQEGPFFLAQLRDKWRKRHALGITKETPYWQEGLSEWLPLSTIEESLELPRPPSSQKQPISKDRKQMRLLLPILIALGVIAACAYFFLIRKGELEGDVFIKGELEGEVFIVTKGGQNHKLGLVTVSLLPLDELTPYLKRKEAEAAAALERFSHDKEESDHANNAAAALEAKADAAKSIIPAVREQDFYKSVSFDEKIKIEAQMAVDRDRARNLAYRASKEAITARGKLAESSPKAGHIYSGEFYFTELPKAIATAQTNADGKFTVALPVRGDFALAAVSLRTLGNSAERYLWLVKVSLNGSGKKTVMLSNNNLSSTDAADSLIPRIKKNRLGTQ
jgi:hypothetical protein